jgi:hypothetical protein
MSSSVLVKLALDRDTEHVTDLRTFQMGAPTSELHGLAVSRAYPGMVWATLQRENKLLLLDPQVDRLDAAPSVVRSIDVAAPGFGPHQVNEIGDQVWAGLKYPSPQTGKYYVLAVDHAHPADQKLYECLPQPVFQAQEPASGIVYASQDASSSIMRIDHATGRTDQIPVPPQIGQNAVGLIRCDGPLAGVWGVLAGGPTGGTGAFYRVRADGQPPGSGWGRTWVSGRGCCTSPTRRPQGARRPCGCSRPRCSAPTRPTRSSTSPSTTP